jgi:predicted glycosyltransferase
MANLIKRILLYTHNVIGLGHAFRSLAVITAIRKWRKDIDFIVMTGSSIPQVFFREAIEVIRLPGIKMEINNFEHSLKPRYLKDMELWKIFDYRQKIIMETFDFFEPHVLIVEHNMGGLMNEVMPLLLKKSLRTGTFGDFAMVHLSRGILCGLSEIKVPYSNHSHKASSLNISHLYDYIYILENREILDFNREYFGNDPSVAGKIHYLGAISHINPDELLDRKEVNKVFHLTDKPLILINLSRHGRVVEMIHHLMASMERTGIKNDYEIIIMIDPYLEKEKDVDIRTSPFCKDIKILPFTHNFPDLLNCSEMIICRGGYNTVNEILLTGAKALIIPEHHPSGEQERRVSNIHPDNITVKTEEEILMNNPDEIILELLKREKKTIPFKSDKYNAGLKIINDLEEWAEKLQLHNR